MENNNCNNCNVVANSLSSSCPSCGTSFYTVSDRQRVLGIATLLCIAIMAGFFTIGQSFPAVAG
jgi:hypothetical protein